MKNETPTPCVICTQPAVATAAHIPVCQVHHDQYASEATTHGHYRPFWIQLQRAYQNRQEGSIQSVPALLRRIAELEAENERLSQYRSLVTAGGGR